MRTIRHFKQFGIHFILALAFLVAPSLAQAGTPFSGTLFYTKYQQPPSLKKMDIIYDGNSTCTISNISLVTLLNGADGLIVAPDGDLVIGGAGDIVYKVNPNTAQVQSRSAGGGFSLHMSLDPNRQRAWSGRPESLLIEIPLNPFAAGTLHTLTGDEARVNSIAWDGAGNAYYTYGGANGFGNVGTIDLTRYTTHRLLTSVPASHGLAYDPFTRTLILFGDSHITQYSADPVNMTLIGDLDFSGKGFTFDQGSVDGRGHIFVADNNGTFVFVDYSATGVLDKTKNFIKEQFIENYLDDVAPVALVGNSKLADLVGSYSFTPSPAMVRSNLTISLVVSNAGPDTATTPITTFSLPANVQFVSASSSSGSVTRNGTNVVANLGNLANGALATITLVVKPVSGPFQFSAISSSPETDPYFFNNLVNVNIDAPFTCFDPPAGLISWWPADGSTNDIVSTNHGTFVNGGVYLPGKVGQSFYFNGLDQGLMITDNAAMHPASLTTEGWVNLSAIGGVRHFIAKPYLLGDRNSYVVWMDGNVLHAYSESIGGANPLLSYTWNPTLGTWHHWAYTIDKDLLNQKLYLDGQLVASNSVAGAVIYDDRPLIIGADYSNDRLTYTLIGQLDEVALYGRALSEQEIGGIYQAGSAGKCSSSIVLTPDTLPDGTPALAYSAQLGLAHASPAYTFSRISGALPNGLNISSSGLISGTPTALGNFSFTIQGTDAQGLVTNRLYSISIVAPTVRPAGMLAWWKGETNALDELKSHNGTLQGNVTFEQGRVGMAFKFDGNGSYVETGAWSPGTRWSVEAWVNPAARTAGRHVAVGGMEGCRDWGLAMIDGQLAAQFRPPGGCSDAIYTGIYPAVGTWTHMVETCDGTNAYVYVNGVLAGTRAVEVNYQTTAAGVRIGGDVCCGDYWQGLVDEPAIYNRALTQAEALQLYRSGVAGKLTGGIPPTITAQPVSITISPTEASALTVTGAGTGPFTYQWYFAGVPITGANSSSLPILGQAGVAGSYKVTVSNAAGTVFSNPASVTLLDIKMFAGLIIDGPIGTAYRIDYKEAIGGADWTQLTTLTLTASPFTFIDFGSPGLPKRFYRAVAQP